LAIEIVKFKKINCLNYRIYELSFKNIKTRGTLKRYLKIKEKEEDSP